MAPQRRSFYEEESTSSDENNDARSDATFEPLPKRRKPTNGGEIAQEGVRKRGRGPSKRPCLNRNAQMARENRQKKKEYLQKIENKLAQLQQENKHLNTVIQQQNIDIKKLNADVLYLRSVLNNKSSITLLLKSMNQNIQRLRMKTQKEESLPNQRVTFSNLETSERKPFTEDYRIKREGAQTPNNGNYPDFCENYRINSIRNGKIVKETTNLLSEMDHNYTSSILSTDEGQSFDHSRQEEKLENLLPVTPISLDGKSEVAIDEADFNEFPYLNNDNIFDHLTQLDEMSNTVDFGQDNCSILDDNFFQGLDETSGICLHVNPSRVSLEFCSSCQMNSANSAFE